MAENRRRSALRPLNGNLDYSRRLTAPSCMTYKDLIRIVGVDPELGPSSWRKAIDHSADTVVFYQVDLRACVPHMSKSIRIRCAEDKGHLVPSVYIGSTPLSLSFMTTVIGRPYLADEDDLMKLLEYVGVLLGSEVILGQTSESVCFSPETAENIQIASLPDAADLPDDEIVEAAPKRARHFVDDSEKTAFDADNMTTDETETANDDQPTHRSAIDLGDLFTGALPPLPLKEAPRSRRRRKTPKLSTGLREKSDASHEVEVGEGDGHEIAPSTAHTVRNGTTESVSKEKFKDLCLDGFVPDSTSEDYYVGSRTFERHFALKNPPRVLKSACRLEDTTSPWCFQMDGPDMMILDESFPNIFVDNRYHLLDSKFLKHTLTPEQYIWYLMSRLLGGTPGLIRLATVYDVRKEESDGKRQYNFYESVLGSDFFRVVEKKASDLVREMIPEGEMDSSALAGIVKNLPSLPPSLQSFFGHKFANWMDKYRQICRKRKKVN